MSDTSYFTPTVVVAADVYHAVHREVWWAGSGERVSWFTREGPAEHSYLVRWGERDWDYFEAYTDMVGMRTTASHIWLRTDLTPARAVDTAHLLLTDPTRYTVLSRELDKQLADFLDMIQGAFTQ